MDCLVPTPAEPPEISIGDQETPSPGTAVGLKGGGGDARMLARAAVAAAVQDELPLLGVEVSEFPVTLDRIARWVWQARARR